MKQPTESSIQPLLEWWCGWHLTFLSFNKKKTEIILFGPNTTSVAPSFILGSLEHHLKSSVNSLGVVIDSDSKLDKLATILSGYLWMLWGAEGCLHGSSLNQCINYHHQIPAYIINIFQNKNLHEDCFAYTMYSILWLCHTHGFVLMTPPSRSCLCYQSQLNKTVLF